MRTWGVMKSALCALFHPTPYPWQPEADIGLADGVVLGYKLAGAAEKSCASRHSSCVFGEKRPSCSHVEATVWYG